jgi:hypothetical protein
MLDEDLAALYEVEIKALNQAVKRNLERFPDDFMFQLTADEFADLKSLTGNSSLRSQTVTLKSGRGQHRKYLPYAFTEQGVAMLSSVLRSERSTSTLKSCAPSCGCDRCYPAMPSYPANLPHSKRNTMPASKPSSKPSTT